MSRTKPRPRNIDPSRLIDLGDTVKAAGRGVLKGMRETPGGDAYEYHGSMAAVEWLRGAIEEFEQYQIFGEERS
jgi:hypothetical protein